MSYNRKSQIARLGCIDSIIRNKHYPSKKEIKWWLEDKLFENLCNSTIEKDIHYMREHFDAPIKYSKKHFGYYYSDSNFDFTKEMLLNISIYYEFPKEIISYLAK